MVLEWWKNARPWRRSVEQNPWIISSVKEITTSLPFTAKPSHIWHAKYQHVMLVPPWGCNEKGVQCSGAKHLLIKQLASLDSSSPSPVCEEYSGDISIIPTAAKEIQKLPVGCLKAILHFHNIPTEGSKDQLVLRVLAIRTKTTHLLFERELKALEDLIKVSKIIIGEEVKAHTIVDRVVYREQSFQRDKTPSLSETWPQECASISNQDNNLASITPIPEGISLLNLNTIFDQIQRLITAQREVNSKKADPNNSEAIQTPWGGFPGRMGARMVHWGCTGLRPSVQQGYHRVQQWKRRVVSTKREGDHRWRKVKSPESHLW